MPTLHALAELCNTPENYAMLKNYWNMRDNMKVNVEINFNESDIERAIKQSKARIDKRIQQSLDRVYK